MVTEEDGAIVMAMPDDPPDGLVHSPGRLLPVPVLPGQDLWGAQSRGLRPFWPPPLPTPVVPHLAASPALALHLIQELHLQDHPGVLAWGVREACDDHPSAIHVCEVQPLTGLGMGRTLHLAALHELTGLPQGPPTTTHVRGWAAGEPSMLGPTGAGGGVTLPGPP